MPDQNAQLLQQIRDIKGLDPFPWWPIAPGWWYLLGVLLVLGASLYALERFLIARRNKNIWKHEALKVLSALETDTRKSAKEKIASLAILLRKLAIRRHGRGECAGLEGRDWLKWLTLNDPVGFDWERDGRFLVEAPYAPEGQPEHSAALQRIMKAVKGWIR
ncbi:MAG: DUF4381 domain-containing protein [Rhodospirillales bacterium]|nr:DUF4381 domain-containing protein [Alphaproteobacteria bacterium]MCB9977128.1 DUF4381 domain-containing protein [Rhodospirillales bacterium]